MKIRLEVGKNKSMGWPWALRTMEKIKGHRVAVENGVEVHTVEFDEPHAFAAVFSLVESWKMVNVYVDEKLVPKYEAQNIAFRARQTDHAISDLTRALRASTMRRPPEE